MTPHERYLIPHDSDPTAALRVALAVVAFFAVVGAVVCFRAVVGWWFA